MKYNFSGTIRLNENKLGLEKPLAFISPVGKIKTTIKTSEGDDLFVEMEFETESLEKAQNIAQLELMRTSNLLSWFENIGIEKYWINGYSFPNDKGGRSVVSTLTLRGHIVVKKTLGEKSLNELKDKLEIAYNNDTEDVLLMWKDALKENSNGMKFFLFFRILESLYGSRTNADKWIRSNYPKYPLEKGQHGEDVSVFTFLRDNVHAKSPDFPFEKVEQYINDFQSVVRRTMEDKFPKELKKEVSTEASKN